MGLLDTITAWIRRESADVSAALSDLESDLDADISRKERELEASPQERLAMVHDEITDDPFAEIRERIDHSLNRADAMDERNDTN